MKKRMLFLMMSSMLLAGCGSNVQSSTPENEEIIASRVVVSEDKNYVEVDGKPFIYNGAQIRADWLIDQQKETIEDMEYYFEVCESLGVKMVEIPIQWKDIEPKEGAYNFRNVSKLMHMAKNHNLKIEFLLFGVNIGGMTSTAPQYIKDDPVKYPQYENKLNHPDALFFVQSNENTIDREKKAVAALMDSIYNWSKTNSSNVVVAIQVRNEPDLFYRRCLENEVKENGSVLTYEKANEENLFAINEIAKIVKESKYKVITRVNICCYADHPEQSQQTWDDITSLESVDIVGEDTYSKSIAYNKNILLNMKEKVGKKNNTVPQIAENDGGFENTGSMYLMANTIGAGYNIYDLITPAVITDSWGYKDWGMLDNKTKEPKTSYYKAIGILKGINLAGHLFPTVKTEDIAAFNIATKYPSETLNQTIKTTKSTFKVESNNPALAYCINYNDYIYFYSTYDSKITITDTKIGSTLEQGYMKDDKNYCVEKSIEVSGNSFDIDGETLYRVKAVETSNQQSTVLDNMGDE